MTVDDSIARGLSQLVGSENVLLGRAARPFMNDATESSGLWGHAEAVALPATAAEVAAVVAWCHERGVTVTPRGGGTGYAGGAVPHGGVVVAMERLQRVRAFDPLLWRGEFEAGVTTATVRRMARENGLLFPPDPGASEQSQIGGNVATNAGGPHAFKYGVTGVWVTGLEAVLMSGEMLTVGGWVRKDVAGYDLRSLLIGSEGTLAIITSVFLRFIPAPEAALPVVAAYSDTMSGCQAVQACLASGIVPSALEYLDGPAIELVRDAFPGTLPAAAGFLLIAEADGDLDEASRGLEALRDVMADGAITEWTPETPKERAALWRWREGLGIAADAALGGKVSEDIAVPIDRLGEAIEVTRAIAERHGVTGCSWGHAGDGNLHSTFMFRATDNAAGQRAQAATQELFALAIALGGTVSGEHGVGTAKAGQLRHQWSDVAVGIHADIKRIFDPKDLLNPGKKVAI